MKKAFQRTCIACNKKTHKNNLIRIVEDKLKQISVDKTGKTEGRGAYICNNIECLEKMIKTNKIQKVLKNSNIDKKIYDDIRGVIVDNEEKEQKGN